MTNSDPALEDRFVMFFDFLGASSAAKTWPRQRIHQFVDLLIAVSHVQSAQAISGGAQNDGSYKLSVTPEVTTFSDNAVVSYPSSALHKTNKALESVWTEIVLKDAVRILSGVAERGLGIGLLIRGGLSFGQLYHDGDVVFGEAMVDAYTLESTVAVNPRVVVSDRVISKLTNDPPENINVLMKDTDGKWHLDYFKEMVRQSISPEAISQAAHWKSAHVARIDHEISILGRADAGRAAKWKWSKERFEDATSQFPAYFP